MEERPAPRPDVERILKSRPVSLHEVYDLCVYIMRLEAELAAERAAHAETKVIAGDLSAAGGEAIEQLQAKLAATEAEALALRQEIAVINLDGDLIVRSFELDILAKDAVIKSLTEK